MAKPRSAAVPDVLPVALRAWAEPRVTLDRSDRPSRPRLLPDLLRLLRRLATDSNVPRDTRVRLALLLGYDFFHQMDIEFDLPHRAVRLFQPKGCKGASLAYWGKEAVAVPLEGGRRIFLSVRVNGKPLSAELDSGATSSSLSAEAALQLGVTSQTAGVTSAGCSTGLGRVPVDQWLAPFESFALGNELVRNPKIPFGDLWQHTRYESTGSHVARRVDDLAEMLLGSDFLRAHRILVAHSQDKLYFSYVGGTIFPVQPAKPCDGARSPSVPTTGPPS
jgi:hypothetical protein